MPLFCIKLTKSLFIGSTGNFYFLHIGLIREPKWGHLKDLHTALKLCEPALVSADSPQYIKLGPKQEV